jgi:ABC-type phosphate/phosphonate transport system substrate-binding protein
MSIRLPSAALAAVIVLFTQAGAARAADPTAPHKVSYSPGTAGAPALLGAGEPVPREYVFSAPPREPAQVAAQIYGPLAEYLSQVTGKAVTYRHPGTWIEYQSDMRKGAYDLVFDGPHLNAWRAAKLQHNILVKAPGDNTFVVAVRTDSDKLRELKQLAGRPVCGISPPNLGTLAVLNEFDNPARQPIINNTDGWEQIYSGLQSGRCMAAILPARNLAKYDTLGSATRVIHKTRAYPNQALSAGPRVTPEDQAKIARAMTRPDARAATAGLRDAYALSGDFQAARKGEFASAAAMLKDSWFYQ